MEMTHSGRRALVAVLVVALVPAAAGCGGGDTGTTAAAALTQAQFAKRAERICREGLEGKDKVLQAAFRENEGHHYTVAQATQKREELVEDMLPHYQAIATELGELQPPPKGKAKIEDIVRKMEAAIAKGKASPLRLVETNLFDKSDTEARAYGLESCGAL
jgi:hypothetical protein